MRTTGCRVSASAGRELLPRSSAWLGAGALDRLTGSRDRSVPRMVIRGARCVEAPAGTPDPALRNGTPDGLPARDRSGARLSRRWIWTSEASRSLNDEVLQSGSAAFTTREAFVL